MYEKQAESSVAKRLTAMVSLLTVGAAVIYFSFGTLLHGGLFGDAADALPLHEQLLHAQQSLELALGKDNINGVFITEKRLLLDRGKYSEQIAANNAALVDAYAQKNGLPFYWMVIPSAIQVYSDTLPDGAKQVNEQVLYDAALKTISPAVNWIDAVGTMYDVRDSYIYYRSDTRWTTLGAFYAYKSAIRKLGFANLGLDRYTITHHSSNFRGNLYKISGYDECDADVVDIYQCENGIAISSVSAPVSGTHTDSLYVTDKTADAEASPLSVFLPETEPFLQIETEVHNTKKLILLCDEFGSNFVPFLTQHYHSVDVINFKNADAAQSALSATADTQVLLLCSADTLASQNSFAFFG